MRTFERRHEPLLPRRFFLFRTACFAVFAAALVAASLLFGVLGYHWIAGLAWLDAYLNASMILTGMGPVDPMRTSGAKAFAAVYALFSGVVFLHRLLHRFHLKDAD